MKQYSKGCSALKELNMKPAKKGNKVVTACQIPHKFEIFDDPNLPTRVGHKYDYLIEDKKGDLLVVSPEDFEKKWSFIPHIKVITPGHIYELPNFEQPQEDGQTIYFIQKIPDPDNPDKLITVNDGTTNEAVIQMLIYRLGNLEERLPSTETREALDHLWNALKVLKIRTRRRKKQKVEETNKWHK